MFKTFLSILLDICLSVGLLNTVLFLIFQRTTLLFCTAFLLFTFPPTVYKISNFSIFSPALVTSCFLKIVGVRYSCYFLFIYFSPVPGNKSVSIAEFVSGKLRIVVDFNHTFTLFCFLANYDSLFHQLKSY